MLVYDPKYQSHLSIRKIISLPVLSVLTIVSPHTEPPPYDFLNLYGACLQAPGTAIDSVPTTHSGADYLVLD